MFSWLPAESGAEPCKSWERAPTVAFMLVVRKQLANTTGLEMGNCPRRLDFFPFLREQGNLAQQSLSLPDNPQEKRLPCLSHLAVGLRAHDTSEMIQTKGGKQNRQNPTLEGIKNMKFRNQAEHLEEGVPFHVELKEKEKNLKYNNS